MVGLSNTPPNPGSIRKIEWYIMGESRNMVIKPMAALFSRIQQMPNFSAHNLLRGISRVPLDYWSTGFLYLALPFLAGARGIPLNYDWRGFFLPYLIGISLYSIGFAVVFHAIQNGVRSPLHYAIAPFLKKKVRLLFLVFLFIASIRVLGLWQSLVIFIDLLAVLGYVEYLKTKEKRILPSILGLLIPAAYFSLGFILIASYNVLIGSVRYFAGYDDFFNACDRFLLMGWSVIDLSHLLKVHAPAVVFTILEKVYFLMFPQIGATIILLTIYKGPRQAVRFVGTLTIAYQMATLIYFILPSLGPFFLAYGKSMTLPSNLVTTHIQVELINKLDLLWRLKTQSIIGLDFYIAFPCMHLAQPLIVLWFLRSMKSMVRVLVIYDTIMLFAIVFLQWHYLVDFMGGVLVAVIAIKIHEFTTRGLTKTVDTKRPLVL
jgi:hypothetical protein